MPMIPITTGAMKTRKAAPSEASADHFQNSEVMTNINHPPQQKKMRKSWAKKASEAPWLRSFRQSSAYPHTPAIGTRR